ncbi:MAG: phosphatidylserine decarboxylase family protein [Phycisphaerales bacterium]|nr:MAG: phosphatidylserine decarboxylase family protein [Phycisphaerales bacterium]
MRVPLSKYGLPQVVVYPLVLLLAMGVLAFGAGAALDLRALLAAELLLALALVWILSFFRDPRRDCPSDKNLVLAPADGRITDIESVVEEGFIGGAALRIGIFLSVFDAHINRAPCNARVAKVVYRQGRYTNAMNPESARVNESNDLGLVRRDAPTDRVLVRQISGAIARRIVCDTVEGRDLAAGEKFGMIKFGSRTELYLAARENARCLARVGDKVKAGLTALARYE